MNFMGCRTTFADFFWIFFYQQAAGLSSLFRGKPKVSNGNQTHKWHEPWNPRWFISDP